jgi:hypothetical protein
MQWALKHHAWCRFSQMLNYAQRAAGDKGHNNSGNCSAEEVQALLVLFARNAAQLRVPRYAAWPLYCIFLVNFVKI